MRRGKEIDNLLASEEPDNEGAGDSEGREKKEKVEREDE